VDERISGWSASADVMFRRLVYPCFFLVSLVLFVHLKSFKYNTEKRTLKTYSIIWRQVHEEKISEPSLINQLLYQEYRRLLAIVSSANCWFDFISSSMTTKLTSLYYKRVPESNIYCRERHCHSKQTDH